jgi:hypothetical protein
MAIIPAITNNGAGFDRSPKPTNVAGFATTTPPFF